MSNDRGNDTTRAWLPFLRGDPGHLPRSTRLTDGGNQVASVFLKAPMQLSDYMASFDFEVQRLNAGDAPADGFTFAEGMRRTYDWFRARGRATEEHLAVAAGM